MVKKHIFGIFLTFRHFWRFFYNFNIGPCPNISPKNNQKKLWKNEFLDKFLDIYMLQVSFVCSNVSKLLEKNKKNMAKNFSAKIFLYFEILDLQNWEMGCRKRFLMILTFLDDFWIIVFFSWGQLGDVKISKT